VTKKQIAVLGATLLLIVVAIWWSSHQREVVGIIDGAKAKTLTVQKDAIPNAPNKNLKDNDPDEEKLSLNEKIAIVEKEFSMPISFYGKVIDEKGNSVADANVNFSVNDLSESGDTQYEVKSNPQGLFSISGIKGGGMSVGVSKDGYYSKPGGDGYFYYNREEENHVPNPNKPVVFHLRKRGEAAELIHREKLFGFSIDGKKHFVDLLAGKKFVDTNPQGDFCVSIIRSSKDPNGRFDWEVILDSVNDSGFIESSEEFMFQAPESGYQSTLRYGYHATDPNWKSQERRKFFVKSRQGKFYTRLEATVIPDYNDKGAIDLNYYTNPDGSRNLEYDKNKEIEVKVK
jgi:hypothetical protein